MIRLLTLIVLMSLVVGVARADEQTLFDSTFDAGNAAATVRGWDVYGPDGGTLAPRKEGGAMLSTTREPTGDDGETWRGTAVSSVIEVLPGRRYRFEVDARGRGPITLGMIETGWRYSAVVIDRPSVSADLGSELRTYRFDYVPTSDAVSHVRPFVRVDGWYQAAVLVRAAMHVDIEPSPIAVKANHFLVANGEAIRLTVAGARGPVKLLLYGSSGVSGPGGAMSGAAGFVDQFKMSRNVDVQNGDATNLNWPIPADLAEGAARVVAVDTATGAAATAWFNVMPPDRAAATLKRVAALDLAPGTKLLFLGDSLTAHFPGRNYASLLERAMAWKFGDDVTVINAGVGGNSIPAIEARLDRDVFAKKPTHVFLFEGANDSKRLYSPEDDTIGRWAVDQQRYEETYRRVAERLRDSGAKVVVMTCAPGNAVCIDMATEYKRLFAQRGNVFCLPDAVAECVAIQKRIAATFDLDVIDTNAHFDAYMQSRAADAGRSDYLHVDDGVHLSDHGNREVAWAVLDYLAGE